MDRYIIVYDDEVLRDSDSAQLHNDLRDVVEELLGNDGEYDHKSLHVYRLTDITVGPPPKTEPPVDWGTEATRLRAAVAAVEKKS